MDLKRGTKAVQELETNAVRISALIPELEEVKSLHSRIMVLDSAFSGHGVNCSKTIGS